MSLQPLIQATAFDVADWEADAEFGVFPQGARAKDAVFAPSPPPAPMLVGGKRYLFKRSKRSYPDQFWGEVIAYRIGCLMGLDVPPAFAAFNSRTGYSAALIEWFYRDGEELFVLGGDFMQMVRQDFDRDRGTKHNLQDVERLLRALVNTGALSQNWRQWWVEALLFDALIGNSDRHQDNWGLIFDAAGREPPNMPPCRLAHCSITVQVWVMNAFPIVCPTGQMPGWIGISGMAHTISSRLWSLRRSYKATCRCCALS